MKNGSGETHSPDPPLGLGPEATARRFPGSNKEIEGFSERSDLTSPVGKREKSLIQEKHEQGDCASVSGRVSRSQPPVESHWYFA